MHTKGMRKLRTRHTIHSASSLLFLNEEVVETYSSNESRYYYYGSVQYESGNRLLVPFFYFDKYGKGMAFRSSLGKRAVVPKAEWINQEISSAKREFFEKSPPGSVPRIYLCRRADDDFAIGIVIADEPIIKIPWPKEASYR